MSKHDLARYVTEATDSLKDFQRYTVDAVYARLFESEQRCMLVADEVGLGKTIVARGLIAKKLAKRLESGTRTPFRVTYICSNQVIAHENVRKLNIFPTSVHVRAPVSRLALLALDEAEAIAPGKIEQHLLELNSLTPATSFEVQNSSGIVKERAIIFALLHQDRKLFNRSRGLQWLLRGSVEKVDRYRNYLKAMATKKYRDGLPKRFVRQLKREKLPATDTIVYEHLRGRSARSVYDAVVEFAEMLDGRTEKTLHYGCLKLIHHLRRILIRCCLRYVNADLYILDEFQRFRELIDLDNGSEQAIIAREVLLSRQASRVLLLSATPFKAFTDHDDVERGDDHHRDFRTVLRFLFQDDPTSLAEYDRHRQGLYKQLLDLRTGEVNVTAVHRDGLEALLRFVMCRTERNSVADDPAIMIADRWREPVEITAGDIENFRSTDRLVQALNRLKLQIDKPVEYCKSAPYPLSYLDHYKIKEVLDAHKRNPEIKACLLGSRNAWLNLRDIHEYKFPIGFDANASAVSNARLSMLVREAIGEKGAELLWIPPSLPYYDLEGSFAGTRGFTKTLVFSAWVMVPRVIGTLLSYEIERRTVGNPQTREASEKRKRKYFTADGKRRHPVPQIRFSRKGRDRDAQMRNMSNFCLLYPSLTLASIVDVVDNLQARLSLDSLRKKVITLLDRAIKKANLQGYCSVEGDPDRWYWAAPVLLDKANSVDHEELAAWFGGFSGSDDPWCRSTYFRGASENATTKESHFAHLRACYERPDTMGLGPLPGDLADVLADLVLGSPAVLTLRTLRRVFPQQVTAKAMVQAFDVADEFTALFNKPESIATIRLGTATKGYFWQMAAKYCASGCLQAVLDEYFHVLKGQNVDAEGAIAQVLASISLHTPSINVDNLNTFFRGEPKKMRCHYAIEFGSQRIETDQGGETAKSRRDVFNSPFRPFVLATTSIGQEGLDFHSYCRRIVHWNLPSNPIDLEQREGRINQYKGLVIRQCLATKYCERLGAKGGDRSGDIWERLFEIADQHERRATGKCELVPYWHVESDKFKIERVIPLYPYSKEQSQLSRILKTLAVYRLAFGQPRQPELVEHLLKYEFSPAEMRQICTSLMIDLSPINYMAKTR